MVFNLKLDWSVGTYGMVIQDTTISRMSKEIENVKKDITEKDIQVKVLHEKVCGLANRQQGNHPPIKGLSIKWTIDFPVS